MSDEMREAFEREFSVERNDKGFYPETTERLMWLACKFGYEQASLASKPQVTEGEIAEIVEKVQPDIYCNIYGINKFTEHGAKRLARALLRQFEIGRK